MKKTPYLYFVVALILLTGISLQAQNWAGPDQDLCGSSEGSYIGLENAPSEYCYSWSPTTGIQGDPHQARVLVKPEETTIYSITVTGSNFSFMQIDEVEVDVSFGAVEFNPGYTKPDGSANQSTAIVTNNPGNKSHTWSIVEPAGPARLGCSINPTTGVISGCNLGGEITIRATRDDFPVCKAEKVFRVNTGVKDIEAMDLSTDNGMRVAKEGQTLYLVGRNGVKFTAIPNDNETFGPDDFMWSGPGVPTTGVESWTSDHGMPLTLNISANDKSVTVKREPVMEITIEDPLSSLKSLFESGLLKFKPVKEYSDLDEIGSCLPPFDADPPEFMLNYKQETTNKYNSPDKGWKYTLEGVVVASATGRMCFPPPYSSPPNPFGFYYTYAFLSGTVKVVASGSKDEGAAANASWAWNNLVGEGEIKAGLGADFGVSLPGDIVTVNGSLSGSTALTLTIQWNKPHVEGKIKFEPLIVEGSLAVWVTNPNDPIAGPVGGKWNIVDPYESMFTPIFTFE